MRKKENNNTKETAQEIPVGIDITGFLGNYNPEGEIFDDADVYKVQLTKGKTYKMMFDKEDNCIAVYSRQDEDVKNFIGRDIKTGVPFTADYTGYYYICFYNYLGEQLEYKIRAEEVIAPPENTSLTSVKAGKKSFTAKWKVVGCEGYELQYGTKSNFKGAKTKVVAGSSKKSVTIKKLKKGKKYYVRVRTYKTIDGAKSYSVWSKKKSVKVK